MSPANKAAKTADEVSLGFHSPYEYSQDVAKLIRALKEKKA